MQVKAVTKYKFKGREFNSLEEIKEEIHNIIGLEVIDKINRVCPPQKHKDLFNLLEVLCSKEVREILTEVLNVTFEKEIENFDNDSFNVETETINILDIK